MIFFRKFSDLGVESIIYTDINNDGVLKGPNFINILKYMRIKDDKKLDAIDADLTMQYQDLKNMFPDFFIMIFF